jgi:hypothetical protein
LDCPQKKNKPRTAALHDLPSPYLNTESKVLGWFIFLKIEDNGAASLTHHLPASFGNGCFLVIATASGCRLVEAKTTSRTAEKSLRMD